jgi:hypothetical protein
MWFKYAAAVCVAGLVAFSATCTNPIGGTDTGNPKVSGVLFNNDGTRAKNALVRFIPTDYNPRNGSPASFDSAFTNDTGMYSFDSLPTNFYNVLGNTDDEVSFQDSVVVISTARTIVPSDTLKKPGSLEGVVQLQPGDDCSTVFLIVMGTTLWTVPTDSLGHFSLSNLAEGEYRLRVVSMLDQYQPLTMVFTIQSGKTTTVPEVIKLHYTGIPIPTGVCLVYDPLMHQVMLAWDSADSTLVKGYCIYRSDVDENTTFEQINRPLITDTQYVDTTLEDSTTYAYKICAVDKGDNKGKLSAGVQVRVGTRLLPRIVEHPVSDTVLSGSSVLMKVFAEGPEPLSYAWYIKQVDSVVQLADQNGNELFIDSVKFSDTGCYFCIVSNSYGSDTSDCAQVTVDTILSPVIISQPRDTSVSTGTYLFLKVIAKGSPLLTYTWYKNGVEIESSVDDTILWLPDVIVSDGGNYHCVVQNSFGADTSAQVKIVVIGRPENTLTLLLAEVGALQVRLTWTNNGEIPYDSFQVWYATTPIPDVDPSPTIYSRQGVSGTLNSVYIRNLKELTAYYFGIQGMYDGIWSLIPAAAKAIATTPTDTSHAIPNTMKILGVEYDTSTFKIRITYQIDPLGFQHRVGFTWVQRSQGIPPLPTEFAEPTSSPRVGEIDYIDKLGQVITFEFDPVNASPALDYGKEYYFSGWVSKVGEKWELPTDSSIFYYAIPQPKAVPAVIFNNNTDTVTAFNGQIVLRKIDPMETSVILRLKEGLSLDSSGLIPVSIAFILESNTIAPVRLLVGLKYDKGLIPVGATAADIRMYHFNAVQSIWQVDTGKVNLDTNAQVLYVQKLLSDRTYPCILAVPDNGNFPYRQDNGRVIKSVMKRSGFNSANKKP